MGQHLLSRLVNFVSNATNMIYLLKVLNQRLLVDAHKITLISSNKKIIMILVCPLQTLDADIHFWCAHFRHSTQTYIETRCVYFHVFAFQICMAKAQKETAIMTYVKENIRKSDKKGICENDKS